MAMSTQEIRRQQRFVEESLEDNVHVARLSKVKEASDTLLATLSLVRIRRHHGHHLVQLPLFGSWFASQYYLIDGRFPRQAYIS